MKGYSEQDHEKLMSMLSDIETLTDRFYDLTCKQTGILESGSVEQLDINISERQSIIENIDAINEQVGSLLSTYEHLRREGTPDDPWIKQVALILERIRQKLMETRSVNEKNEEMARKKRDELKLDANRLSMQHKSIRAYNQDIMTAEPFYYDKKE